MLVRDLEQPDKPVEAHSWEPVAALHCPAAEADTGRPAGLEFAACFEVASQEPNNAALVQDGPERWAAAANETPMTQERRPPRTPQPKLRAASIPRCISPSSSFPISCLTRSSAQPAMP
jgi:hypothetical protein